MGKTLKILFVVIFVADFLGLYYHLFQDFFWLDIVLHFLGGVWLAIFFAYWSLRGQSPKQSYPFFFWAVFMVSFVALVGVLWEFSEYTFLNDLMMKIFGSQETAMYAMSLDDTLADLAMDLVGATATALGYWISKKKSLPALNR